MRARRKAIRFVGGFALTIVGAMICCGRPPGVDDGGELPARDEFFRSSPANRADEPGRPEEHRADGPPRRRPASVTTVEGTPSSSSIAGHTAGSEWQGPQRIEEPLAGLDNVIRVSSRIYSGSEPHGDAGFASLARLGVKTVVSVDGARPNVTAARRAGLRYVHIPVGYDGISPEAGAMLARLVRDVEPPFFVHCHHGRHRGPAAAAAALVADGLVDGKSALQVLEIAGTGKNYSGLWRGVESYQADQSAAMSCELVEVAEVDTVAAAMARVDRAADHLELCKKNGWRAPPEHADLAAAQEALLLKEGLREAARNLSGNAGKEIRRAFVNAERMAADLQQSLLAKRFDAAEEHFERLRQTCTRCHQRYRDTGASAGTVSSREMASVPGRGL